MCQTALVYVKIDVEELRKFRKIYLQYLSTNYIWPTETLE